MSWDGCGLGRRRRPGGPRAPRATRASELAACAQHRAARAAQAGGLGGAKAAALASDVGRRWSFGFCCFRCLLGSLGVFLEFVSRLVHLVGFAFLGHSFVCDGLVGLLFLKRVVFLWFL